MAKINMEPRGRFALLLAKAVEKKGISLRDLAGRLDYTYEQMRKLWLGNSLPSPLLLKAFANELGMDLKEAKAAVAADKIQRDYGSDIYKVLGYDKRFSDVSDILPQLSDVEWGMFVNQMRGFVQQRRKQG